MKLSKNKPKTIPDAPTKLNDKGYSLGGSVDREFLLRYLLRNINKKLEENPEAVLRRGKVEVSFTDMKVEVERWIKVWFT
jgi:hypothetical protein